jgi:hypothetical protein
MTNENKALIELIDSLILEDEKRRYSKQYGGDSPDFPGFSDSHVKNIYKGLKDKAGDSWDDKIDYIIKNFDDINTKEAASKFLSTLTKRATGDWPNEKDHKK